VSRAQDASDTLNVEHVEASWASDTLKIQRVEAQDASASLMGEGGEANGSKTTVEVQAAVSTNRGDEVDNHG
jgi:hypothetical protein